MLLTIWGMLLTKFNVANPIVILAPLYTPVREDTQKDEAMIQFHSFVFAACL
jgi:hypothetical protein